MTNFGGDEVVYEYAASKIIIVPVPYDETSTWLRGADKGPEAVMEASVNLEFYDAETGTEVHRKGIHTIAPVTTHGSPEELVEKVRVSVRTLLSDGKFPVLVGGNHTISIGAVKAFSEHYKDLSVLQLDAHSDLRDEYNGSRYSHACVMARVMEFAPAVQVGIRSMSAEEVQLASGSKIYYAHDLYYNKGLYSEAISCLTRNVYITIDLDVFDPSLIPSTGTPEPGGPAYFEVMHFLREVARKKNVVGFDVVELCPSETNKTPDFVAARIIYQLLTYIFL